MKTHKIISVVCVLLLGTYLYGQQHITLSSPNTTGGTLTACQSILLQPGFSFTATPGKSLSLSIDESLCHPSGSEASLSHDQNYIHTRTYTSDDGSTYLDAIQYFDGLGRPVQTVQRRITPQFNDLVTLQEYDSFGRQTNTWLPGTSNGNGGYADPESLQSTIISHYSDIAPYSKPVYENSALNRVLEQYGPGNHWHTNNASVKTNYLTNTDSSGSYPCRKLSVSGNNLKGEGYYPPCELYLTEYRDENNNLSYEFTDKLGRLLLTRQINGTDKQDTYYVYDDFDNKRFVLPPLASDGIIQDIFTWTETNSILNKYAYLYQYDERKRCIKKRIPGCEWIKYVYDRSDRLIFTQDGEQALKGQWIFTIPDIFGRIVLTGLCTNTNISNDNIKDKAIFATYATTSSGYSSYHYNYGITDIALSSPDFLVINYYDNYYFTNQIGFNSLDYTVKAGYNHRYGNDNNSTTAKGLLTGTITQILNNQPSPQYLFSIYYHDYRGRLIQTASTNHLGFIEKEYIAYSFISQPENKLLEEVSLTGTIRFSEQYSYIYDHAGRNISTEHQINNNSPIILSVNEYDEACRLKSTTANNDAQFKTDYTYNVRSWLTRIHNYHFTENMEYSYNGNITTQNWQQANKNRTYTFAYDNLSRLLSARFSTFYYDDRHSNFSTSYSYDKHGNVKHINRYGYTGTSVTSGLIDNVAFTYNGNQLQTARENASYDPLSNTSYDFKDYSYGRGVLNYRYDKNGSMIYNPFKGTSTTYNKVKLPYYVEMNAVQGYNLYTYSADGAKLRMQSRYHPQLSLDPLQNIGITITGPYITTQTDYVKNREYTAGGNILTKIYTGNGYFDKMTNQYYFYVTDHLGNNRVVIKQTGDVVQQTEYYPFGMPFGNGTGATVQKHKYGNKEFETSNGLNQYDFLARQQDPAEGGRFTTIDPQCEKYYSTSPYAYVANNPMNSVDLRGDTITTIIDGQRYYWGNVDGTYGFIGTNGELYSGENVFIGQLMAALNSLRSKRRGRELVDYLSNSTKKVDIKYSNKNNSASSTGKRVQWNPDNRTRLPDTAGGKQREPFIGLSHEMAHIEDIWKGTFNKSEWLNLNGTSIPEGEKYATHVENQIRAEHGMPLRTHYAMYHDASGVPATQILYTVGNKHFSSYINQNKLVFISNMQMIKPVYIKISHQY